MPFNLCTVLVVVTMLVTMGNFNKGDCDMKMTVTLAQLEATLAGLDKESEFTIDTKTVPSGFRKTNNPNHGNCWKVSKVRCKMNINYGNEVMFQQVRDGVPVGFTPKAKTNPVHRIANSPFAQHDVTGEKYLPVIILESLGYHYQDDKGNVIPKADVHAFMPTPKMPQTQVDAGISKEVMYREYKLSSITDFHTAQLSLGVA